MPVLLVDGNSLLSIGFHGCKNFFYKGKHIGGIYHFLNTLRKCFDEYRLDKIVVFWDGENSTMLRKKIYHQYKENRKTNIKSQEEIDSFNFQRERIKAYLEEIYVRQGGYEFCEADDCIAYYCQNSENEKNKLIYSSDGDLTQLVSDTTNIYNPSHRKVYKKNDQITYNHESILIENVKIIKILCGDPSDNISGIKNLGIKRLINLFPEIQTEKITLQQIIEKSNILFETNKNNNLLNNLLTGVTKYGVFGEEFFVINEKIVNLDAPFLTEEAIIDIKQLITNNLDSEGRSYKNALRMMKEDGIFTILPKSDDSLINFFNPFLRLTRKEKNSRTIKIKDYEQ